MSGKMRLAILSTVIWFILSLIIIRTSESRFYLHLILIFNLPSLVVWGAWWVKQGFKSKLSNNDKLVINTIILNLLLEDIKKKGAEETALKKYEEQSDYQKEIFKYFLDGKKDVENKLDKKLGKHSK